MDLSIRGSRFEENLGRVILFDDLEGPYEVRIEQSAFVRNRSLGSGGVNLRSNDFLIRECSFVENVSATQPSIVVQGSTGTIEFGLFERDSCLALNASGAGIQWRDSEGIVANCTFVGCFSPLDGAAFVGALGGSVEFRQNLVTHSAGAASVRVTSGAQLRPGTGCNIFWMNQAGDYGTWPITDGDTVSDPFYCDPEDGDYTVRGDSPCVIGPCAPVGALGEGCSPVSVGTSSWAGIKALYRREGGGNANQD
jgi:hypothetical protein